MKKNSSLWHVSKLYSSFCFSHIRIYTRARRNPYLKIRYPRAHRQTRDETRQFNAGGTSNSNIHYRGITLERTPRFIVIGLGFMGWREVGAEGKAR